MTAVKNFLSRLHVLLKIHQSSWYLFAMVVLSFLVFDFVWWNEFKCVFRFNSAPFYLLFYSLLLSLPALLFNAKKTQSILNTILCIWLWSNMVYAREFENIIPISSYSLARNVATQFMGTVKVLIKPIDLLFIIPIIGSIVIAFRNKNGKIKVSKHQSLLYFGCLLLLFVFSWGQSILRHSFRDLMVVKYSKAYTFLVPIYTPAGIISYQIIQNFLPLDDKSKVMINDWWNDHHRLFASGDTIHIDHPPKKVIILTVESLESWALERVVEGQPIMPRLKSLVQDSAILFLPNIVSQVKQGSSSDTQLLTMSGMLPLSHGVWGVEKSKNTKYTLPDAFAKKYNVKPLYAAGVPGQNWHQREYATSLGFKRIICRETLPDDVTKGKNWISDDQFLSYLGQLLNTDEEFNGKHPFFVEIVTISSHSPFSLPNGKRSTLKLHNTYPSPLKDYMLSLRFTDDAIGSLLDALSQRDDYKEIMIIIMGDHTILHRDVHNIRSKIKWFPYQQTVPLIIVNGPKTGRVYNYAGQVDIYTTLLDLLGLETYLWRGMGVSIFNANHPGTAISPVFGVMGDSSSANQEVIQHQRDAYNVSDMILYYGLESK